MTLWNASQRSRCRRLLNGRRRGGRAAAFAALGLTLASVTGGCRDAAASFGPTPPAAASSARDLFGSMALRFTNVERAPKFARARGKLGRYALTPSKIWDDSSVWLPSAPGDRARELTLEGEFVGGRYVFVPRANAPLPARLADSRHDMRLRRLGDGEYEWATSVDHAVGDVRAASTEDVYTALVASAVRLGAAGDGAVRANYRAAFPRTTATLGQLFSLDGVHTVADADGAATVIVTMGLHPDGLRNGYPAFADYVKKYVAPSHFRFTLRDARGARWFDATARENVLTFRLRATADGRMVPLDGAPRPMPDSLTLTGEFFTHILVFDVGVSELRAGFTVLRTPHERGWALRFAKEPEWHLPLGTRYMIRAPLRRPFEQGGATLRIAVRDSAGAQTLLARRVTMAVRESAVLRFLGALGFTAMSDFAGKSEAEENRFNADVFNAMRADAVALGLAAAAATGGGAESAGAGSARAP